MIIKAAIKLQDLPESESRCFVARDGRAWGKGLVREYEAIAGSWSGVRSLLKQFDVIGAHRCNRNTAGSFTQDIGQTNASLREVKSHA